jgi:hypothetical protein
MTSRVFWALITGASIFGATVASADAQSPVGENTRAAPTASTASVPNAPERPSAPVDSTHAYDARALRFESSWGNVRVIRGADGELVGTSGWFRDIQLTRLVASSPAAVAEARVYETNNFRGSLVGTVGALAASFGVVLTTNSANNASSPALIIGGMGAMWWGVQHLAMSYSALSRALWWYNRDLTR